MEDKKVVKDGLSDPFVPLRVLWNKSSLLINPVKFYCMQPGMGKAAGPLRLFS